MKEKWDQAKRDEMNQDIGSIVDMLMWYDSERWCLRVCMSILPLRNC